MTAFIAIPRFHSFFTTIVALALALPSAAAADHTAAVKLNAPPANVETLFDLEDDEIVTLLSHSYYIPYNLLEPQIAQNLEAALQDGIKDYLAQYTPSQFPVVYDCPGYCGQVRIWLAAHSGFRFTEEHQAEIEIAGPATYNRVLVTLRARARVRIDANLRVVLTEVPDSITLLPTTEEINHAMYFDIDLPMKAQAMLTLWPVLDQEWLTLTFDDDVRVTDNDGISHKITEIGTEVGIMVGLTPGGLLTGGPLAWGLTSLVIADEVGDIIEGEVSKMSAEMISEEISSASDQLEAQLKARIDLAAQQGNDFLDSFRNQVIPGLGITLEEAKTRMGLQEDVRPHKSGSDVSVVATARFAGTGAETIRGRLVLPDTKCVKTSNTAAGGKLIVGYPVLHNSDLEARLGQSCATALGVAGSGGLQAAPTARRRLSLGAQKPARPAVQRAQDAPQAEISMDPLGDAFENATYRGAVPIGTDMPRWSPMAAPKITGNLVKNAHGYECGWEISGYSNIAAVKLTPNDALNARLANYAVPSATFLVASAAGQQTALNWRLKSVGEDGIVLGGQGPGMDAVICYFDGSGIADHPSLGQELMNAFDPETCPQCMGAIIDPANQAANPAEAQRLRPGTLRQMQRDGLIDLVPARDLENSMKELEVPERRQ